jgi:hypothetical protein
MALARVVVIISQPANAIQPLPLPMSTSFRFSRPTGFDNDRGTLLDTTMWATEAAESEAIPSCVAVVRYRASPPQA